MMAFFLVTTVFLSLFLYRVVEVVFVPHVLYVGMYVGRRGARGGMLHTVAWA
jgi:hypothetical protein